MVILENKGITAPKGYKAYGEHVGLKKVKRDLAILFSENPALYVGTFTQNIVKAAPVLWNMERYEQKEEISAIVVNSGNANACTGKDGITHTKMMAEATAKELNLQPEKVLVASTGVIGVPLKIDKIVEGITQVSKKLDASSKAAHLAAEAIMTTDTYTKEIAVSFEIGGKEVRLAGMAKGSGMIHPNMATMLAFLTTDINISKELLNEVVKESIFSTYNMISVDGDTSTNDMMLLLANGMSENPKIEEKNEDYYTFKEALSYVNTYLAKQIVNDGEGVTKVIEVQVDGASSEEDARKLAKSVITSNLVKTAFFGEDANWGRILCAMGYSGANFDPLKVSLIYASKNGTIQLLEEGLPIAFDEEQALHILKEREITVKIQLQEGKASGKAWGCDLSYEYVKINGEYRT